MSFGENSGLVSAGLGQGFAQGTQQGIQNYEAGIKRQKDEEDRQEQQRRYDTQQATDTIRYNTQRADVLIGRDTEAAARALQEAHYQEGRATDETHYQESLRQYNEGITFRNTQESQRKGESSFSILHADYANLKPPAPPPPNASAAEIDAYVKSVNAYDGVKTSMGKALNTLWALNNKDVKGSDGQPLTTDTFTQQVTGLSESGQAEALATRMKAGSQLTALGTQLDTVKDNLSKAVQAGGVKNNPEYDRLKAQADDLVKQMQPLYKTISGVDYKDSILDYGAIELAADQKGQSNMVTGALGAFGDNPEVRTLLGAIADYRKPVKFSTKLSDLGIQGDNRTINDVLTGAKGNKTIGDLLDTADYQKAIAVVTSMTPEEVQANPRAKAFYDRLTNMDPDSTNPTDLAMRSALSGMEMPISQLKNLKLTGKSIELGNTGQGLTNDSLTNKNSTYVSELAATGNPDFLGMHDRYVSNLTNNGTPPAQAEAMWEAQKAKYDAANKKDDLQLGLMQQASAKGTLDYDTQVGELISTGNLYLMDLAGVGGDLRNKMGSDKYKAAVAKAQEVYTTKKDFDAGQRDLQVEQIKAAQFSNHLNNLLGPLQVRSATADAARLEAVTKDYVENIQFRTGVENEQAFLQLAQQGSAFLADPKLRAMAEAKGINLGKYDTIAKYSDWVRTDAVRTKSFNEFMALMDNPAAALSAGGRLRELTSTLGMNYDQVISNLTEARDDKRKLTSANLTSILTNTRATAAGITNAAERLTLDKDQQRFAQNSWRAGFKMSQADYNLRLQMFKQGQSNDQFDRQYKVLSLLDSSTRGWASLSVEDKSSLRQYIGIVRAAGQDSRALGTQYLGQAQELAKNPLVARAISSNAIVKNKDGTFSIPNKQFDNETTRQYTELLQQANEQFGAADAAVKEMGTIKGTINNSDTSDQHGQEIQDFFSHAFGETGGLGSILTTNGTGKGKAGGNLSSAYRTGMTQLPGNAGKLMASVLKMADDGATDPYTGKPIQNENDLCSMTLRLVTSNAGIPTDKYFGGSARQTWGKLKTNGLIVNGGKPVTTKNLGNLQPGDMLFQETGDEYGHIAMYIGNGQVFQHSRYTNDGATNAGGNLGVMTLDAYTKAYPTYAGRMKELSTVASPAGAAPLKTPAAAPTAPSKAPGSTQAPAAAPVKVGPSAPLPSGPAGFQIPKLPAGSYRANITSVGPRDLLAVPTGKPGQYNLMTDSNAAANIYRSYVAQATKMYGQQYKALSPADQADFVGMLMKTNGFVGDFKKLSGLAGSK